MRQSRFFFVSFTPLPLRGISPLGVQKSLPCKGRWFGFCRTGGIPAAAFTPLPFGASPLLGETIEVR